MSGSKLTPMEQLIAFCDFERQITPHKTHVAEWALAEIYRLMDDAARYRFIRRKFAIVGGEFVAINLPRPVYRAPDAAYELDAVIDQARQKLAFDQAAGRADAPPPQQT